MGALKYQLTPYAYTNENHVPRLSAKVGADGPPQTRRFTAYTRDDSRNREVAFCEHSHRSLIAAWKCADRMLRHFKKQGEK